MLTSIRVGGGAEGGGATVQTQEPQALPPTCSEQVLLLLPMLLAWLALGVVTVNFHPEAELGGTYPLEVVQTSRLYSFPFMPESVSFAAMLLLSILVSAAWCVAFEYMCASARSADLLCRWLIAWGSCWEGVGWTLAITQLGKTYINEPRPDFHERCWPRLEQPFPAECDTTQLPSTEVDSRGYATAADGLKAFPSGHSSSATAIGGYLTGYALWCAYSRSGSLLSRLPRAGSRTHRDALQLAAHRAALALYLLPLVVGLWVAATRIRDFRHHPWDVNAGVILGLLVSAATLARVSSELKLREQRPLGVTGSKV